MPRKNFLLRALPLRALCCLSLLGIAVGAQAGCAGGTDQQPAYPDPSVVDPPSEDLDLPEEEPEEDTSGSEADMEEPQSPIRVVAGERQPIEGDSPQISITSPLMGATVRRGDVSLRINLEDWELQSAPGRHVHVIVDNEPYIAVRDVSSALNLNELVQENLGHELAEGTHVVRIFPSRGHHESVKTDGAFAAVMFHYRSQTDGFTFNPDSPLLTFSRPKGCSTTGSRLLLDFYVSNAALAADGHRVHYSIDDAIEGDIANWAPHWIEGLPAMSHTIELTLLGPDGQPVDGPFNQTRRTIRVASSCE
ncbi:MAG: hypothetical protein AB8I08_12965 [Sandaracinaceae bacterium]